MYRLPLLLAVLGMVAACSGADGEAEEATTATQPAKAATPGMLAISAAQMTRLGIRFAAVEAAGEVPVATVPATLAPPPNARVAVAAIMPGVVTRTLVVEGDSVRRGQALAVIAAREMFTIAAGIEQASARVGAARASDRRLGQLAREGVIAGARADEARAALREAEAELNEQRRIVRLVNGSPAAGSYTLTAPIAGTITRASVQTGMPVDGASAPYVIDAAGRYELTAQLPERLIGTIRPGMTVMLDGVSGTVTSVGATVEAETRSALLRARIPAAPGLVAGRATTATLLKPADGTAVAVPSAAVVVIDGRPVVFVRTPAGVVRRAVTSAGAAGGRAVLTAGVKAGEQVAVAGTSELKALAAN